MWVVGLVLVLSIVALVIASVALALCNSKRSKCCTSSEKCFAYYLSISDFISSFIEIPTENVSVDTGTTIASSYLVGRAPLYDAANDLKVGTCSASFLNQQTADGIFTDIGNFIQTDAGFIITWWTPTKLLNLALDELINGLVTTAIVKVTTKVGASAYFGKTYLMNVSSDGTYVHFQLKPYSG